MAKLRTNYGSGGSGGRFATGLAPAFALGVLLCIVLYLLWQRPGVEHRPLPTLEDAALYLPTGPSDQVIEHRRFTLGYDNGWEQARWVAHELTAADLADEGFPRTDNFRRDPAVRDGSAEQEDYRRSGFTRGHLVPAADLRSDRRAMDETFLLSNISPQLAAFNGGIWRELEESVRDWTEEHNVLYVVTGPIVEDTAERIGPNQVAVPKAFYKVVLTAGGEGIGFVIPHEVQELPLSAFAKTIDEVEAVTGLDFYPEMVSVSSPATEAEYDLNAWPLHEGRFRKRVSQWNQQ